MEISSCAAVFASIPIVLVGAVLLRVAWLVAMRFADNIQQAFHVLPVKPVFNRTQIGYAASGLVFCLYMIGTFSIFQQTTIKPCHKETAQAVVIPCTCGCGKH